MNPVQKIQKILDDEKVSFETSNAIIHAAQEAFRVERGVIYCWNCESSIATKHLDAVQEGWEYDQGEDIYTCPDCKDK